MALSKAYVFVPNQVKEIFAKIQQGQAPEQFGVQHLKDLGFTSSNHRAFLPLLKALGFLTADGRPTARYTDYRDPSRAKQVMGQALREAYGDLFVISANPSEKDRAAIEGKFKSAHNVTDGLAKRMSNTFYALLALADLSTSPAPAPQEPEEQKPAKEGESPQAENGRQRNLDGATLHYNIQIHLPATKDIEVFNAIFKSLREHLID